MIFDEDGLIGVGVGEYASFKEQGLL